MQSSEIREGVIIELDGDFAKIRLAARAECENCKMCDPSSMVIIAFNPLKALPGQMVRFTDTENGMLKISFMLFFFPMISVFAGLYAGSVLSSVLNFSRTGAMSAGAVLFLLLSAMVIVLYDKKYRLNRSNFPRITEVIR